jgi:protoporphyrin/coproporphyrin ferrochelatase
MKTGVLLVNLGTPDRPDVPAVRRYLAEFLSDERVLDMHPFARALLLYGVILPFRPKRSAAAYQKVWDAERGSPLLFHSQDLAAGLQAALGQGYEVRLAMRYGQPDLPTALEALEAAGCGRLVLVPLYPQYASSSTGSTLERVYELLKGRPVPPALAVVPDFYDHPGFIGPSADIARPLLADFEPDHVLMSFHGLPEHQVKFTDFSGSHCLSGSDCCAALNDANRSCYRAQCFATARALASDLGLPDDAWSVSFQSRLTKVPWIKPYTDIVVPELAKEGVRRLAVLCPSFVSDCLETLEEIGMGIKAEFEATHDDAALLLVPCVNSDPRWVEGLAGMVRSA